MEFSLKISSGEESCMEKYHHQELLSQLRPRTDLDFLVQLDVEVHLNDLDYGVPAAGVHHPLLDRDGVPGHGVDED